MSATTLRARETFFAFGSRAKPKVHKGGLFTLGFARVVYLGPRARLVSTACAMAALQGQGSCLQGVSWGSLFCWDGGTHAHSGGR